MSQPEWPSAPLRGTLADRYDERVHREEPADRYPEEVRNTLMICIFLSWGLEAAVWQQLWPKPNVSGT